MIGSAVLGDDQGAAFGEAADLFGAEDVDVVAGHGAVGRGAGLPAGPGDPDGADQVGDFFVEGGVLRAAEHDQDVGQAEHGAGFVSPKIAASCRRFWAA